MYCMYIMTDCSKHSDWKGTLTLEDNVYLPNEIVSSQSKVGGVSFSLTVVKGLLDIFKVLTNGIIQIDGLEKVNNESMDGTYNVG